MQHIAAVQITHQISAMRLQAAGITPAMVEAARYWLDVAGFLSPTELAHALACSERHAEALIAVYLDETPGARERELQRRRALSRA